MLMEMFKMASPIVPEVFLLFFAIWALIIGVYHIPYFARLNSNRLVYVGFMGALILLFIIHIMPDGIYFGKRFFVLDSYAVFVKRVLLFFGIIVLAYAIDWLKYKKFSRFEYSVLLAFSVAGMMMAVSAESFLMLFLGLELAQTPLCFMVSYKRQGERSTEAGAKYILLSILSSGLFLFGVSVIFVCLGTFNYDSIASAQIDEVLPSVLLGSIFVFAGLAFRIGLVPFHAWAADTYEGAPTPVTAFIGIMHRLFLLAVLARILWVPLSQIAPYWQPALAVIALLCVLGGALGALMQTNIKRLAAYTILSSNGFALLALVSNGMASFLFFLVVDTLLLSGLFAIILSLRIGGNLSEYVQTLSGQARLKPVRGALFTLIFLGLTGLPPFAGFWGRFFIFHESILAEHLYVPVLAMIGSLITAFVYLRIIRQIYFSAPKDDLLPAPEPMRSVILAVALISVFMLVFASPLWLSVQRVSFSVGG